MRTLFFDVDLEILAMKVVIVCYESGLELGKWFVFLL